MTTQSTEEAMALLEKTRAKLILVAKGFAISIAEDRGEVHVRSIWEEMKSMNINEINEVKAHWLGAVFNRNKKFRWTGRWFTYSDKEQNIHERTVKVWELK